MKYIPLLLTTLLATSAFASKFDETLKLAEKGDAVAQANIGNMYELGIGGVDENQFLAVEWYKKAARQGYAAAQNNLGFMYSFGKGVPKDIVVGYAWLSLAKMQGSKVASYNISIGKSTMTAKQIADGQALAAKCFESNYKDCD